MSILVDKNTRLVVQGITGREGEFHARQMLAYGTAVVAGVTPGKGGQTTLDGRVPVFNSVREAVEQTGANVSIIYVPASFAPDAIKEAASAGVALVVCITEGIPALDMISTYTFVQETGARLLGPNCPGLLTPGEAKVGIIPGNIAMPGPVGVVSKSGTLTYEVIDALTRIGIGQTTCVGIGGDPIIGTNFIDILTMFQADPATEAIVMIGEIGGTAEQEAAAFIRPTLPSQSLALSLAKRLPKASAWAMRERSSVAVRAQPKRRLKPLKPLGLRLQPSPPTLPRWSSRFCSRSPTRCN